MKTEINNVSISFSSQLVSCDKNIYASEGLNSPYISSVNYSNEIKNDTPEVNINLLQDSALKLSLKYYGKLNLSRKQAIELQVDITDLITNTIAMQIETKVLVSCTDSKIIKSLETISEFCKSPFRGIDTEYKFLKQLQDKKLYEKPNIVTLNNTIENIISNHNNTIDEKKIKGVLLPIKFQFQKYFELPGVLNSFLASHSSLNSVTNYTNFFNGELWKHKISQHSDKIIIPYFLYFDDFEINNPLGSHSSLILGVYYCFPSAPFYLRSNLQNIFIAALFNTKDVKAVGNDKTFFKLIEQLNDLESNGLQLKLPGRNEKIYFSLRLIVGDNLGVNSVLGFSRSFSATFFCRFCHSNKINTNILATEVVDSLRNKRNYEEDVLKNDYKQTGVHEKSVFNLVNSFHVVQNFSVDLMHDIFEGVCVYDMCHIILNLIKSGYFNLETLNNRKQHFQYGESEIGNISPPLRILNSDNMHIKMSAREMQTFVHFFPLLVGDLVPENDQIWKFLLNLIQIIDLLLLSTFDIPVLFKLQKCIEYHNLKYVELFNDNLKPKHHFLTHYCSIIKKSGPLKFIWSYNFESKHKQLKSYTKNTNSRINVPISRHKIFYTFF